MEIYEIRNDHRFAGLVAGDDEFDTALLSDFCQSADMQFPIQTLARLGKDDEPSEKPLAEMFLLYGLAIPIIRDEAFSLLRDVLGPCVVAFPCASNDGAFLALRVGMVAGAFDCTHSVIEFAYSVKQKKKVPRTVSRYAFDTEKLTRAHLFSIPEFPLTKLFATSVFTERWAQAHLGGLEFAQVFPSDK
jgi:hypothetical protein